MLKAYLYALYIYTSKTKVDGFYESEKNFFYQFDHNPKK